MSYFEGQPSVDNQSVETELFLNLFNKTMVNYILYINVFQNA